MPASSGGRVFAWWTLLVLPWLVIRAEGTERGFPLVTVYPPETHRAGPQTFDVAQDARGVLHFGNLHGLVTFDGAWWELHKLPDDQVALALASNARGQVALGLMNDFGYLGRDGNGSYRYHSLLEKLPPDRRHVGDIRDICSTHAGFLFVAEKTLILWNGREAKTAAAFKDENAPRGCYADDAAILLRGPTGLQSFDPNTFAITPMGVDKRVMFVLRGNNAKLIAVTDDDGLFAISQGVTTPFAPAVGEWLKGKNITGGARLRDGRLIVTTRQHGFVVFDDGGAIEQIIRADAGLPDAVINEAFVDREGSLWLAMEGPIVRIDLASPVTVFDVRRGVRGAAGDVARFNGKLYAATTHGLYEIDPAGLAKRMEPMREGSWRLLALEDELLVGTSRGIYRVTKDGVLEPLISAEQELYDFYRSPTDPARVWVAYGDGVGSIRREGTTWRDEGRLAVVDQEIDSLVEKDGVLWCGTVFDGVLRITDPRGAKPRVERFGSGEANVYEIGGRAVLVRASGQVVQPSGGATAASAVGSGESDDGPSGRRSTKGQLEPDRLLGHLSAPRGFFVVSEDARGNVWINSTPPRLYERQADGTYAKNGRPLVSVTAADIQNIVTTSDGAVWFASDKGLFRYDPAAPGEVFAAQSRPLIRRVLRGDDRVLFGGAISRQSQPVELRHDFGRIRIEFAPASYRPGVEYQYRLDPIDSNWSNWTEQPFIDYTTLGASDYNFRLRARGAGSPPSAEAQWQFAVLPPWYATGWAQGVWLLLGVALILIVIRVRTDALRRQAERLKAKVAEQTAELQETVKLLEAANTQLEALSLEDDLTGIANRRFFERALTDEWNRARRHEQPLALVLLDLDHFKDLNDRRGHPAGDDCLRRVGGFLSEAVRRSGEVVARYGGEEFAILLPATDGDSAVRVAETLRDGIEKLGIPYGNGTGKRVTASCGVAALTPSPDISAENLVASADRALYAAKHSGRNCVRMADETTTGTWLRDASA